MFDNLRALVYGHELTNYQRSLAQNEFEQLIKTHETKSRTKIKVTPRASSRKKGTDKVSRENKPQGYVGDG